MDAAACWFLSSSIPTSSVHSKCQEEHQYPYNQCRGSYYKQSELRDRYGSIGGVFVKLQHFPSFEIIHLHIVLCPKNVPLLLQLAPGAPPSLRTTCSLRSLPTLIESASLNVSSMPGVLLPRGTSRSASWPGIANEPTLHLYIYLMCFWTADQIRLILFMCASGHTQPLRPHSG